MRDLDRPVPPLSRLVHVFTAGSGTQGFLVKGLLESDGIPVFVKGESEGPYRMGFMYLWVPEEFEVQARMLIDDAVSGRLAEPDEDDAEQGAERGLSDL